MRSRLSGARLEEGMRVTRQVLPRDGKQSATLDRYRLTLYVSTYTVRARVSLLARTPHVTFPSRPRRARFVRGPPPPGSSHRTRRTALR